MVVFIYLFIVASVALILIGIAGFSKSGKRRIALPQEEGEAKKIKALHRTRLLQFFFTFLQKLLEKFKLDVKIKNKLDSAHVNLQVGQFFSIKLIFMLAAGIAAFFVLKKIDALILFVSVMFGYFLPDIWLSRKVVQRRYEIARVLPETVDLLGLCVEAGLDFTTSVKWVIEKKVTSNPMIEQLSLVLDEIKWGKPRSQALRDMAKRLNIPEVSSVVQALVQAERMGTPVAEAFSIISEDTRLMRFRRGERYALQAPIKILLPLIFCILPVIGIIIGGPILLQFVQGGIFKGFGQ